MTIQPEATVVEVLRVRAAARPEALAYRFLPDGDAAPESVSYGALLARAAGVARKLAGTLPPGSRVLVSMAPGLEYVIALYGVWLAGMVAVPAPPLRARSSRADLLRENAGAALVIDRAMVATCELDEDLQCAGSALALLQYTSGSTRAPRGVRITHGNLAENCARIVEAGGLGEHAQLVSWLPPWHDMGLVAGLVAPMFAGCPATLMSPFSFVTRPVRWLEAMTRYGGTHAGAPDFAYALCARRVSAEQKRGLDLSRWRSAWNGAERVRPTTLAAFASAFAEVGFRGSALRPCYGLAEATLMVSVADGPRVLGVSDAALAQHEVKLEPTGRMLASSGHVVPGHELYIVDAAGRETAGVGEIWLRGPSLSPGYHDADMARGTLPGRGSFLRTGDLGFVHDGELFVTGRLGDVLNVQGRNLYPEDLEFTAQAVHPALTPSAGAVFALEAQGEERLCLVQEVDPRDDLAGLVLRISEAVLAEHDVALHDVVLVAPGQVPKTTSGKVQRARTRALLEGGELRVRARRVPSEATTGDDRLLPVVQRECEALLGLAPLDVDANLFELGAQSVLVLQLVARLSRALDLELTPRLVFEQPTARGLARALCGRAPTGMAPAPHVESCADTPLSSSQARIWFEQAFEPASRAYHVAGALRLRGALDVGALSRALTALCARHGQLRARFLDGPMQVQLPPEPVRLHDVTDDLVERPFDLAREPPLRVALEACGPNEHRLLLVVHHLASDGLSMDVLFDELARSYEAECTGVAIALPALSMDYLAHVRHERAQLDEARTARAVEHFARLLADPPEHLALPLDRPRPPARSSAGDLVERPLSSELLARLDGFCRAHGATRYMTLLAVFSVLMARLGRTHDVVVGTPVTGRFAPETERVVGTFVNMLALRSQVRDALSFSEFLQNTREQVLDAFEHRMAPFERVVERASPTRSPAHGALFDVMFDYQSMPRLRTRVAELDVSVELVRRKATQYDLSLSVLELGDVTTLHLEYRTDLFDPATARSFVERFVVLLESALALPAAELGRLPWLLSGEREALLAASRGPVLPAEAPTFLDAWDLCVRAHGDALAVTDGVRSLSYMQLDQQSRALAQTLVTMGVGPDGRVAVLLERSVQLLVTLCAVLRAGAAYVPLDPNHPKARHGLVLEDALPTVLVCDRDVPLPEGCQSLRIDRPWAASDATLPEVSADALAYVLFTSGSTGRPKGVEVSHGALANFLAAMAHRPGLAEGARLLAVTTVSFDIAALELLLPLTVGACVELVPGPFASDGPRLCERLERGDVAMFQATPATYRLLMEAGFRGEPRLTLLCGGEALPRELADFLRPRVRALYNMYGPTETTVWSAMCEVGEDPGPVPIGRPIAHTQLYVLDARGELVPRGVLGELVIGGAGMARGYRQRPELTASRFVANPFTGGRMYRTGDLARLRQDGQFEYVGRMDRQVKLRGHRIELGDVEAALSAQPFVLDCAVELVEGASGPRLVGYVVGTAPIAQLEQGLRAVLPSYMVPSRLISLAALPRTPNQKLDRRALPVPSAEPTESRTAPRNEREALLCQLFAELLERGEVGADADFFALGGHSLLALRLFERLALHTGVRLPLASLFVAPTPSGLAQMLAQQASESARVEQVGRGVPGLVFVHPSGSGDVSGLDWYRPLAERLPCASLLSTLDANEYLELRELARLHLLALPRRSGMLLAGLGLGGNLAQEMAVQLEAEGVRVGCVVMIQSTTGRGTMHRLAHALRRETKPSLDDAVDLQRLPAAYRALSAPQWNALLRHDVRPCRAQVVHVRARSALVRRGVHTLVLRCDERALLAGEAHLELTAALGARLEALSGSRGDSSPA